MPELEHNRHGIRAFTRHQTVTCAGEEHVDNGVAVRYERYETAAIPSLEPDCRGDADRGTSAKDRCAEIDGANHSRPKHEAGRYQHGKRSRTEGVARNRRCLRGQDRKEPAISKEGSTLTKEDPAGRHLRKNQGQDHSKTGKYEIAIREGRNA